MTDGILLAEIQATRSSARTTTIILDEAHERSLDIDFLLGFVKRLLPRRPDLRVVISSATLETERFAAFFGGAPIIQVSGRTFPVDVIYRPPTRDEGDLAETVAVTVDELTELDPREDVLVFLSRRARDPRGHGRAHPPVPSPHTVLLPLYGRLAQADQARVFQPLPQRRVVLATNVAETSLTIPGIVYVVDTGLARVNRHDPRSGVTRLLVEPISRASADQRKGRAGRTQRGVCFRLYEESDFAGRPAHTDPEILRVGLAGAILRMKALGLGEIEAFPFLDPPPRRAVDEGHRVLEEIGAVDASRALTEIGRKLARLPLDPRVGRMVIAGEQEGALREVLIIAAAPRDPGPARAPDRREGPGRPRAPPVPRRGLRLRVPAQALALLRRGGSPPVTGRDPQAVQGRLRLVPAPPRVDRRARADLALGPRVRAPLERDARERRGSAPGLAPRSPEPHRSLAPRAARLPRRASDPLPDPPLVGPREEAPAVDRRGRAGGDLPALRAERGAHRSGLARGGSGPALPAEPRRSALGRAPRAGDGQGADHPLRAADRARPQHPLRARRPQIVAPDLHPPRAGPRGVRLRRAVRGRRTARSSRRSGTCATARAGATCSRTTTRSRSSSSSASPTPCTAQDVRSLAPRGRGRGPARALPLARRRAPRRGGGPLACALPGRARAPRRGAPPSPTASIPTPRTTARRSPCPSRCSPSSIQTRSSGRSPAGTRRRSRSSCTVCRAP